MARGRKKQKRIEGEQPPPEQLRNGSFERNFITHTDTNTKTMGYRRRDSDPVERWKSDRRLTDIQVKTIDAMQNLWDRVYGTKAVTSRLMERTDKTSGFIIEGGQQKSLRLSQDLARIEGYFDGLKQWYGVFEKVCRFGMTGPEACQTDCVTERAARDRALVVVQFVADVIATKEGY